MKEAWKDIRGYEGKYQVSNLGNVKSLSRPCLNRRRHLKTKILIQAISKYGYPQVLLYNERNRKTVNVHRLVAQAFVKNPLGKRCVNHIDGNKANNYASNLEWVTESENATHAFKNGLRKPLEGARNKRSKQVNQYSLSGEPIRTWESIRQAGRVLNISQSSITQCCKNRVKTVGGFKWQYVDECKELGIETMTPDEINRMKNEWGAKA